MYAGADCPYSHEEDRAVEDVAAERVPARATLPQRRVPQVVLPPDRLAGPPSPPVRQASPALPSADANIDFKRTLKILKLLEAF